MAYLYAENAEIWVFGKSFTLFTTNFGYNECYAPFNFGNIGENVGYFGSDFFSR